MTTHQVNEIKLVDDHGKQYTVFEYQEGTEMPSLKWIKAGPSSFRLSDGTAVDKIDDNTFKIPIAVPSDILSARANNSNRMPLPKQMKKRFVLAHSLRVSDGIKF